VMGASSFSVAASRPSRLRARSAASTGLRQATSRSPGKSSDLQLAFLAVPGVVAAGSQRAPGPSHPGAGQVKQRHPPRVGFRGQVAAGQFRLDRVLPVLQPVHRRVDVIGGRPGHAEVGAQGGIGPPGQGGQFRGRPGHPGDDQRQGPGPAGGPPGPAARAAPAWRPWRARRRRARAVPRR
jgi:hypothetical protein